MTLPNALRQAYHGGDHIAALDTLIPLNEQAAIAMTVQYAEYRIVARRGRVAQPSRGDAVIDRTNPEWVREGQEVVRRASGFNGYSYGSTHTIAKVYKNGNFIVAGIDGQWRAWDAAAHLTGNAGRLSRQSIVPLIDETRAEIIGEQKYATAKRLLFDEAKRLETLARSNDRDAIIAAGEVLAKARKAEGRTDA
jgi:hypothetical protein